MLAHQSVSYDFQHNRMDFPVDIMPIIVSQGKSLVEARVRVPIVPESSSQQQEAVAITLSNALDHGPFLMWRNLVHHANSCSFVVSEEMSKTIEDDYVALRQTDPRVDQGVLHEWLTFSRFV